MLKESRQLEVQKSLDDQLKEFMAKNAKSAETKPAEETRAVVE